MDEISVCNPLLLYMTLANNVYLISIYCHVIIKYGAKTK